MIILPRNSNPYNFIHDAPYVIFNSTTTLLLKFRDDIKCAMKTGEIILGILLDYSKAFETIDHLTLLEKLHQLNFSVQAIKLIHSYVSERKQFVQVDDKSYPSNVTILVCHRVAF